MRWNVIKIDLHVGPSQRKARSHLRAQTCTRARFYRPGTLFGVAKSLIKVRLAELGPDAGGARLGDPPDPVLLNGTWLGVAKILSEFVFNWFSRRRFHYGAFSHNWRDRIREGRENFGYSPSRISFYSRSSPRSPYLNCFLVAKQIPISNIFMLDFRANP